MFPTHNSNRNRVVLVTGVSSGIGLALARKLWRTDYRVVATTRETSLARLAEEPFKKDNERFLLRPMDVTDAHQRERVIGEIDAAWGGIDILVNNAGISFRSVTEHMGEEDELQQLRTNYVGPMELIRLVLPKMREKRWGRIINVSSVGGMMAMPTMGRLQRVEIRARRRVRGVVVRDAPLEYQSEPRPTWIRALELLPQCVLEPEGETSHKGGRHLRPLLRVHGRFHREDDEPGIRHIGKYRRHDLENHGKPQPKPQGSRDHRCVFVLVYQAYSSAENISCRLV